MRLSLGRTSQSFLFVMALFCLLLSAQVSLAQQDSKKRSSGPQKATVLVEGASVYEKPSFDSPIIDYLKEGAVISASRSMVRGAEGFGLFYKVRTPSGKLGFVADIDLSPEGKAKGSKAGGGKGPLAEEQQKAEEKTPMFFTRYLGASYGSLGYSEKFSGKTLSSNAPVFALKISGPGSLIDGPPLDFNLGFSPQAPAFYKDFSKGDPRGFFVLLDTVLDVPLYEHQKGFFFIGFGLMGVYTKFSTVVSATTFDSQEFRAGLVGAVGYAHRFGRFAIRWDSKYYYEKTQYWGHWLSLQMEYPNKR